MVLSKQALARLESQRAELVALQQSQRQAQRQEASSRAEAASYLVDTALMIVKLREEFERRQVLGYSIEAEKQSIKLRGLLHPVPPSRLVWSLADSMYQRIRPGLTVREDAEMHRLLPGLLIH